MNEQVCFRLLLILTICLFAGVFGCGDGDDNNSDIEHATIGDSGNVDDDDDNDTDSPHFMVGFSRVDVTPLMDVKMGGYGMYFLSENFCRWSTGVHDPIYATAVAFENPGQDPVILIHFDLLGAILPDIRKIQQGVQSATGVPADNVVVASSHSHGGPDTIGIWGVMLPPVTGRDEVYIEYMIAGGIEAGALAYDARVPATLEAATGIEDAMHENTQRPIDRNAVLDSTMTLIAAYDLDDRLIGTLMSWGCHPMVMGDSNTLLTADFPGAYYKFMDAQNGAINMFVNGSLGAAVHPTNPYDPYPVRTGGTWEDLDNFGQVLADDAQALIQGAEPFANYDVHLKSKTIYGELRNPFFALVGAVDLIPRDVPNLGGEGETTTTVFSVGDVRFGTAPGELVPNLGLELREVMGGEHQFVINLGMDWIGYMMTPRQYRNLLYFYFSILSVGPDVGNMLVDEYETLWEQWPN